MSSFTKLCRLCLKKCRPNDNYEDLGHDYSIRCKVAVQEIFNIINGSTTFPSKICINCSEKVLLFYDYFVVVQKNQEILLNGINMGVGISGPSSHQRPSLINPLSKRMHYTSIPTSNILDASGTSGPADMDVDTGIDASTYRNTIMDNNEIKPEIFSTPKPFLTFEERKAIEEKIKMIKDNMSDDEKIKIFYGLQCTTCNTSVEFNKLVEYEEHCLKEHEMEVTSFVCCKTKIKREFLIDHIEFHLGTPAVRVLRPRGQTMGPSSIFNNHERSNGNAAMTNNGSIIGGGPQEDVDNASNATDPGIYKFPCTRCERSYMVKSSLKRHMTISHGFTCDVCDKTFDDDPKLKKHQFVFHSTDGPFKCNICGSEHDTRQTLYNHKRWHTRQTNAINPIAFAVDDDDTVQEITSVVSDKQPTTNDAQIIDDDRIFKCSLCSGAFHSNRNLKIHMSLKHKKPLAIMRKTGKTMKKRYLSPFKPKVDLPKLRCKICGFLSMYRQNLKRHIRIRHPESADTEEEVQALCEDTSKGAENQPTITGEEDHNSKEGDKDTDTTNNIQMAQIKEEQEDSINMFQCLSNSLLS